MVWRCRGCNRVFKTPKVGEYIIFEGDDGSGYVFAESIPKMERRAKLHKHPRWQRGRRRSVFRKLAIAIAIVTVMVGVGLLVFVERPRMANPDSAVSPDLRHIEEKEYMLELINSERAKAGLQPVTLGDNVAAQLHAESALENCFSGHWGIDGLKPYMRYSMAGGYQSNGENVSGSDYCIKESENYRPLGNIEEEIQEAMDGWMDSPGHRENILDEWHKKVNIGLAWDRYNFKAIQHFEGDYVEYDRLPKIGNNLLSMSGTVENGVEIVEDRGLGVQIYYDPPPYPLTIGQLARTYCYNGGRITAAIRPPLSGSWFYDEDEYTRTYEACPNPYHVPTDAPAPSSLDEAHEFWQAAYDASQQQARVPVTAPWITALEWTVRDERFSVTADISDVLMRLGNGVYTVVLWAKVGDADVVVSEYSIFYGVTPPDTYDQ